MTQDNQDARPTETSSLRFDGIYVFEEEDVVYCLRFFEEECLVVAISSMDPPSEIAWLMTRVGDLARGVFKSAGDEVSFSTVKDDVQVDYECKLDGSALRCKTYSHYNGNQMSRAYKFVPMTLK